MRSPMNRAFGPLTPRWPRPAPPVRAIPVRSGADGTSHAPITAGFSSTMALKLAILSCALLLLGLHPFLLYPGSLRLLAWLARRPIAGWQTLPGDTSVAI